MSYQPDALPEDFIGWLNKAVRFLARALDEDVEHDVVALARQQALRTARSHLMAARREARGQAPNVGLVRRNLNEAIKVAESHEEVRDALEEILPAIATREGEYSAFYFRRWFNERMRTIAFKEKFVRAAIGSSTGIFGWFAGAGASHDRESSGPFKRTALKRAKKTAKKAAKKSVKKVAKKSVKKVAKKSAKKVAKKAAKKSAKKAAKKIGRKAF